MYSSRIPGVNQLKSHLIEECMEYNLEGDRPRGRPKKTWTEVLQKEYQARQLNVEDAMDRSRWRKHIKDD